MNIDYNIIDKVELLKVLTTLHENVTKFSNIEVSLLGGIVKIKISEYKENAIDVYLESKYHYIFFKKDCIVCNQCFQFKETIDEVIDDVYSKYLEHVESIDSEVEFLNKSYVSIMREHDFIIDAYTTSEESFYKYKYELLQKYIYLNNIEKHIKRIKSFIEIKEHTVDTLLDFIDNGEEMELTFEPVNSIFKKHKSLLIDISNSPLDEVDTKAEKDKYTVESLLDVFGNEEYPMYFLFEDSKLKAEYTGKVILDKVKNNIEDYESTKLSDVSTELLEEIVDKLNEIG